MKKILSFGLAIVLILGLSIPVFAGRPDWAGKGKPEGLPPGLEKREELPKGLQKKEDLPFGLKKYLSEDISVEEMEELIEEIEEYISENELEDIDIVDAINNLIKRIEYELLKEEPRLNKFYYALENKYKVLMKYNGELEIDYLEKLMDLKEDLEELESSEEIEDLIEDIELYIDLGEVSEEQYEEFVELAEEFLDVEVEEQDLDELIIEVREFILENDFGGELGSYSDSEVFELMTLILNYNPEDDEEDLDELYEEILDKYNELKLSKIVGQEYIENLEEYKDELEELLDDSEEDMLEKIDDLIEDIDSILDEDEMTLEEFYDIEDEYLEIVEEFQNYEEILEELIDEAKDLLDEEYEESIEEERNLLFNRLLHIILLAEDIETDEEYQEAIDLLEGSIEEYEEVLD